MLKRSFNPELMHDVLNHSSVKDGAQIKGNADITSIIQNKENVVLQNEYGGFIIIKKMPGIYEWHTQFLPEGRGEPVRNAAKEALRYMFIETDCVRVISYAYTAPARKLAEEFLKKRGNTNGMTYYSLDYLDWVETDQEAKRIGEAFHEMVKDETNHDDDEIHDYHVGAACLMATTGNIDKAQALYNQWALMSHYEPIHIEHRQPLIIRVKDMYITMRDLLCL
jgi:hypothetical protein